MGKVELPHLAAGGINVEVLHDLLYGLHPGMDVTAQLLLG
jgi:hypothetical protein